MSGSIILAMARIARETDALGYSEFPNYMVPNMRQWAREGLVDISTGRTGNRAVITEAGRALARKAIAPK
ncbi:hypothetical protein MA20_31975 [Bradyrhizobium japonicum]|uniref:Uncharacterized protein n=2 Tax=Bradyrhizobium japonicum TaxID=375 RepID=A0A0A3XN44_BRAJP|nr:hypothetical protein MA20_31975 [Bradyrhizobium japonicum]